MQKFTLLIASLCTLVVLGIGLSSCKDDEPFVKPNLSVATETMTVSEGAGTIEVEIVLDKGAPSDITIEYDLRGTAISPADYTIVGKEGEVKISKGGTSAKIQVQIVNDAVYEGNETIIISLEDVDSDDVVITNKDETVITITDDDPQLKASFSTTTLTVAESDNEDLLEVQVVLDNPAPQDVVVKFTLANGAGKALDSLYAASLDDPIPSQYYDYYVEGAVHEVTIAQGTTSGVIQIQLLSDFHFEDDETIEITLTEASNGVEIGTNNKMTITVEQEDGMVIALVWDNYTDVDMDLFLWIGQNVSNLFFAASSTNPSVTERVEALFIPAIIPNGVAFGTSYTYWGGTAEPMNFEAQFIEFTNGTLEPQADYDIYPGTYSLANINKWDTNAGTQPALAQTFRKEAGAFVDITDPIVAPASGSRMATVALPQGVRKMKASTINKARKF